jgi:rhodanese-related sulfurtransferase
MSAMEWVALILAVVALLVALAAFSKAGSHATGIDDVRTEVSRQAENLAEEVEGQLRVTRRLVAAVKEGAPLTREMIVDGQLWLDVQPEDAKRMVAAGEVHVLDVRTSQETATGIITGAQHIPVDELRERAKEVPRDGKQTLVYCAGGGRSAAACEYLSGEGFEGLCNLTGGFMSWSGPTERPS